jgi:hypothetical protein
MNSIFKCGALALLPMALLMFMPALLFGPRADWMAAGEVVGYSAMLLCMSATFFAMRDAQRESPAKGFGALLAVGVGVSAVAALGFALLSWAFMAHLGEAGVSALMEHYSSQLRESGGTPEQFAQLEAYRPMLRNSPLQGAVMGATVFVIGVLESLLGATWLVSASRRRMKAA